MVQLIKYIMNIFTIVFICIQYSLIECDENSRRNLVIYHTTDLIAYYSFAGNANDSHSGSHHGTAVDVQPTTNRHGTANSAYRFFSASTVVFFPVESLLNTKTAFSLMAWIKFDTIGGSIFSGTKVGGNDFITYCGGFYSAGLPYNFDKQPCNFYKVGKWHHYAFVQNGDKKQIYVDGIMVDQKTVPLYTADFGVNGFLIGQDQDSLGGGFELQAAFKGSLSDVRIYGNRVVAKDIKQIYLAERDFCNSFCETCNTARDQCLSCEAGKILAKGECLCPQGSYLDQLTDSCVVTDETAGNTLEVYYPLQNNATDVINQEDGVIYGCPSVPNRFGTPNSAVQFTGVTTWVNMPTTARFINLKDTFTCTFWARKRTSLTATAHLFTALHIADNSYYIDLQKTIMNVTDYHYHDDFIKELQNLDDWFHLALVFEPTQFTYYFNGRKVVVHAKLNYDIQVYEDSFTLGIDADGRNSGFEASQVWNGDMSDFKMFNSALTEVQVYNLHEFELYPCGFECETCSYQTSLCASCKGNRVLYGNICICPQGTQEDFKSFNCPTIDPIIEADLLAYYPFHNNATDVQNGNNGTIHGVTPTTNMRGEANSAYQFSDITTWITIPETVINGLSQVSFSIWFKRTGDTQDNHQFFIHGTKTGGNDLTISLDHTNLMNVNVFLHQDIQDDIVENKWYHYVLVLETTKAHIYLNGDLRISGDHPGFVFDLGVGGFMVGQEQDALAGGFDPNQSWEGSLSNYRIYQSSLTGDKIKDIYYYDNYPCYFPCSHCVYESIDCAYCRGDRIMNSGTCLCPAGQFEDLKSTNCPDCSHQCGTCEYNNLNCLTCKGSYRKNDLPNCTCVDKYYDDGISSDCQLCAIMCAQCETTSSNCTACQGHNRNNDDAINNCPCWTGFVEDGTDHCKPTPTFCTDRLETINTVEGMKGWNNRDYTYDSLHADLKKTGSKFIKMSIFYPQDVDCQIDVEEKFDAYFLIRSDFRDAELTTQGWSKTSIITTVVGLGATNVNLLVYKKSGVGSFQIPQLQSEDEYLLTYSSIFYIPLGCDNSCNKCSGTINTCTECGTSVPARSGASCLCPASYFDDQTNTQCASCDYKCATCTTSSTQCDTCSDSTNRITSPTCNCKTHFYDQGNSNPVCLECNHKCLDCTNNATNCSSCQGANRQNLANLCICQDAFYDDGSNKDCQSCNYKCATCSNNSSCDTCNDPTNRTNAACDCKTHFYDQGISNPVCLECSNKCLECSGSATNCDSCQGANRKDLANLCVCQDGFYDDGVNKDCQQCDNSCVTCSGSATDCSGSVCSDPDFDISTDCVSCLGTKTVDSGTCKCLVAGEFDDGTITCKNCDYQCATCSGTASSCSTCADPSNRTNGACDCKSHFYDQNNSNPICLECNHKCLECSGTATNCDSCQGANRKDQANQCVCLDSFYDNGSNKDCLSCDYQCATCTSSASQCDTCSDSTNRINFPTCSCKTHFYDQGNSDPVCLECNHKCQECSNNATNCQSCQGANRMDLANQCVCQDGFYDDGVNSDCKPCDSSCSLCLGSATNCIGSSCADTDFDISSGCTLCLGTKEVDTGVCKCLTVGEFDDSTPTCATCEYQCASCSVTADGCQTCNDPTNRINAQCDCKSHYYDQQNGQATCLECNYKCLNCSGSAEACQSCQGNNRSTNIPSCECELGYFDIGVADCSQCDSKCGQCEGTLDNCINSCSGSNRDLGNNCECLDGYFGSGNCDSQCDIQCLQCSTTPDNCLVCKGLNRDNTDLPNCKCLPGFYNDGITSDCQKCQVKNCVECDSSNPIICLKEEDGYFLDGNTPVQCKFGCKKCQTSFDNCSECELSDPPRIQSDSCSCSEGFYDNNVDTQCQNCLPECQNCENGFECIEMKTCEKQCLKCEKNKDNCTICLGLNRQLPPSCNCQDGFYDNGQDQDCQKCKNSQCQSCDLDNSELCIECLNSEMLPPLCTQSKKGKYVSNSVTIGDDKTTQTFDCDPKCEQCVQESSKCTICTIGLYRSQNLPNCDCQIGYHDQNGSQKDCEECDELCYACSEKNQCDKCADGLNRELNLFNKKCECQSGYKESKFSNKCEKCYYLGQYCVSKCPDNTVVNEKSNICNEITPIQSENIILIFICGFVVVIIQIGIVLIVRQLVKSKALRLKDLKSLDQQEQNGDCQKFDIENSQKIQEEKNSSLEQSIGIDEVENL